MTDFRRRLKNTKVERLEARCRLQMKNNREIAKIIVRWQKAFERLAKAYYGHTGYRVTLEQVEAWDD